MLKLFKSFQNKYKIYSSAKAVISRSGISGFSSNTTFFLIHKYTTVYYRSLIQGFQSQVKNYSFIVID